MTQPTLCPPRNRSFYSNVINLPPTNHRISIALFTIGDGLNASAETLKNQRALQNLPSLPKHGQNQKNKANSLKTSLDQVSRNNIEEMRRSNAFFRLHKLDALKFDTLLTMMMNSRKSFRHDLLSIYTMKTEMKREVTFSIHTPWKKWPRVYDSFVQVVLSTINWFVHHEAHHYEQRTIILKRQVGHEICTCLFECWAELGLLSLSHSLSHSLRLVNP